MLQSIGNIFSGIPSQVPHEIFEEVARSKNCKIERIISRGHSTPDGEWYDQDKGEWVILLKGSAGLLFEGSPNPVELRPGDYVNIPAHLKHRVEWTDRTGETIWLTIHYG
jgi:cupin 2 domain-containing protein